MDGNGRWAEKQGKVRSRGHEAGVDALRRTVQAAGDIGLEYLTVYAFSTENWSRPDKEVNFLMTLLKMYVNRDVARLNREGVRIRMIGRRDNLKPDILALIADAEKLTEHNSKLNLNIAFNYGGRDELVLAMQSLSKKIMTGELAPSDLSETIIGSELQTSDQPDPDLIIRTSGESRLSNFLLWQSAYSELLFMDVLWPDFGHSELSEAIANYMKRERRFGSVSV